MRIALFSLLMFAGWSVHAAEGAADVVAKPFAEQSEAIKVELANGDRYEEISAEDRVLALAALERMGKHIQGAGGVEKLSPAAQVEVFNDQETVNTLLTRARDDSRVVCRRTKRTGSNFTSNHCMTVGEQRRVSQDGRDFLWKGQRSMARGN